MRAPWRWTPELPRPGEMRGRPVTVSHPPGPGGARKLCALRAGARTVRAHCTGHCHQFGSGSGRVKMSFQTSKTPLVSDDHDTN